MDSKGKRLLTAFLVPMLAFWAVAWFDTNVLAGALIQGGRTYDITPETLAYPVAFLIAVCGAFAVAVTAWWARSAVVGFGYLVVGAFVLFDGFLVAKLAAQTNAGPAIAPEPIAHFMTQVMLTTQGHANAGLVVAAAMVVAGVVSLAAPRVMSGAALPSGTQAPAPSPQAIDDAS